MGVFIVKLAEEIVWHVTYACSTQWAAVRTHLDAMREPPQMWLKLVPVLEYSRDTW